MSKLRLSLLCVVVLFAMSSVARAQKSTTKPTIDSISPTSIIAGSASFTLTVNGSNYVSGAVIQWAGSSSGSISTTVVSSAQLTATIPNTLITAGGTAQVSVYVAGRAGGTSNAVTFTITAPATTAPTPTATTSTTTASPLAITTTSVPVGTTGTAYSATLAASGGTPAFNWSVSSGALPPGLTLSTAGAVSGTPTTSGSYSFMAQVADSASHTASYTYSMSIAAGTTTTTPVAVSTASVPNGTAGTAYPSTTLAASGGTPAYSWSVASGSTLPAGLSLSAAGAISGTPTTAGTYSFSVQAKDSANATSTKAYSMTIAAAATTTTPTASLANPAACGTDTNNNPYDQSACGNVGDPYEGGTFSATGKTALSSCCAPGYYCLTGNTSYYLTGNIGSDATATCVKFAHGDTIDLRGYTITGQVVQDADNNPSGVTIFNGTINCSIPNAGSVHTCLQVIASQPMTARARFHHLTVDNAIDPGTGDLEAVYLGAISSGSTPEPYGYQIDHMRITVESAPSASRTSAVFASMDGYLEMNNMLITCSANAGACQGLMLPDGTGNSPVTMIHNNAFYMNESLATGAATSPGRAVNLNGPDNYNVGPNFGTAIYNNYCVANYNRCWRPRQVASVTIQNNYVANCQLTTQGLGCYTLADGAGTQPLVNPTKITVQNETVEMNGGTAFFVQQGNGVKIQNINLIGTSGQLGRVGYIGNGVYANVTFCNISGASSLNAGSTTTTVSTPDTAVVNTFNAGGAGIWTGSGTVNALSSCPP